MLTLIKMLVMSDLSSLFRIESINVEIIDNGNVKTVTQDNIAISKLSGNWTVLHKVVEIIDKEKRKSFVKDNFDETYSPNLYLRYTVTDDTGNVLITMPISYRKLIMLSHYIKTKVYGTQLKYQ
jgi:hypothetical protein